MIKKFGIKLIESTVDELAKSLAIKIANLADKKIVKLSEVINKTITKK